MQVKLKKLHEDAKVPRYAKPGDAGMDLFVTDVAVGDKYIQYYTGIALEIPEGHVGLLFPRSSNSKKDLVLANSVAVIDSGYRGEILFRFKKLMHNPNIDFKTYAKGDACGQIIILPYPQVEFEEVFELSETERGEGGFGSTNQEAK